MRNFNILHSFRSKSYKPSGQKINLVGEWSAVSSSTGSVYTFYSDGSFSSGSAIQTRVSHDATRDKVTTTSWGNDGKWTLKGPELTLYYKSTNKTSYNSIRFYQEKNYDGSWAPQKLGKMSYYDDGTFGEVGYNSK